MDFGSQTWLAGKRFPSKPCLTTKIPIQFAEFYTYAHLQDISRLAMFDHRRVNKMIMAFLFFGGSFQHIL